MPKQPKAGLTKVSLNLHFLQATWEVDDAEERVLRDLVDLVRTRRAFEMNRGMAAEEPDHFLRSILDARDSVRQLMERLPIQAVDTRVVLLKVMDLLASVLDEWHRGAIEHGGRDIPYDSFPFRHRFGVLEHAWPHIEAIRTELDGIVSIIEKQLKL